MSAETAAKSPTQGESWIRRGCAIVVAGVAAYSSYAHQREFALVGGADPVTAALWPLSVDGLVVLASIGLLRQQSETTRRARLAVRSAFLFGVLVSLAANIAAAPSLEWQPIVVAGWPPLALLLAIELVLHARYRVQGTESPESSETTDLSAAAESLPTVGETVAAQPRPRRTSLSSAANDAALDADHRPAVRDERSSTSSTAVASPRAVVATAPLTSRRPRAVTGVGMASTAEDVMWSYYQRATAEGEAPTGADLDRVAGTSNYGRAVLARWRKSGRVPPAA